MAIRTIAANVFLDALRKKVLYVLLLFAGALVLALPVIPSFGVGVRLDMFRDLSLGLTSLFAVVIAVALGANQVPAEVERRTVYNVLSKPVSRSGFIVGKLLGLLFTMGVVILMMAGLTCIAAGVYFGTFEGGIFIAAWTIFVEAAIVSAFVLMTSTFATPAVTVTLAVVFYFVGHVKTSFLGPVLSGGGLGLVPARVVYYLVPGLEGINVNDLVAHGLPVPPLRIAQASAYGGLVVVAFLVVGAAVFQRKDL